MRQVEKSLAAHRFVLGMSSQDVGLLADCAVMVSYPQGAVIFHEGEDADRLFLIEDGTVSLESTVGSEPIVTETVGAGELLGLSWLFPPHRWRVTARVCQAATAIAINGTLLRKYSERDHSLGFQLHQRFTEVMTRRFQSMRSRFLESINRSDRSPQCE
ncbi:MAG: Crp/Fnr family transcriptional regulator [Chthoniobacterales bacterium]